ncbi:hypothetical protein JKF63_02558 [Porcisia hertigi]|uniref:Uncharacterized protein n=1 Tax=Porcisia hertigi TaxID=2761500 RepID=A0A836H9R0_9TRYP|nr:hypothetical protein JKF63_02558 [Porcisia hertigi]
MVAAGSPGSPDKSGDDRNTEAPRGLLTSRYNGLPANAFCTNNSGSRLRGESTVARLPSPTKRTAPSVTMAISSVDFKDPASSWLTFPVLSGVNDTPSVHHSYHDGKWMRSEADNPFLVRGCRDDSTGSSPIFPSDEELDSLAKRAAGVPQFSLRPRATVSSEASRLTRESGCVESLVTEVSQGLVMAADSQLVSSSLVLPDAGAQLAQRHGAGLTPCDSAPALRKPTNARKAQSFRSPVEEDTNEIGSETVQVTSFALASPTARLRGEFSATQLLYDARSVSISGPRASWVSTPINISGVVTDDVTAAPLAGPGLQEVPFGSFSSSMHTFIDHDLEVSRTDSPVFDSGDSLYATRGSNDHVDIKGGWWPSHPKHYLLGSTNSSFVSSASVMPLISRSTSRHWCPPAAATSVTQPAQHPSEYAAAVRAASKYGRSLRQILRMSSDELDDTSQES